jgi:hypothetical protein
MFTIPVGCDSLAPIDRAVTRIRICVSDSGLLAQSAIRLSTVSIPRPRTTRSRDG